MNDKRHRMRNRRLKGRIFREQSAPDFKTNSKSTANRVVCTSGRWRTAPKGHNGELRKRTTETDSSFLYQEREIKKTQLRRHDFKTMNWHLHFFMQMFFIFNLTKFPLCAGLWHKVEKAGCRVVTLTVCQLVGNGETLHPSAYYFYSRGMLCSQPSYTVRSERLMRDQPLYSLTW